MMDFSYVGLAVALFAATLALIPLFDKL